MCASICKQMSSNQSDVELDLCGEQTKWWKSHSGFYLMRKNVLRLRILQNFDKIQNLKLFTLWLIFKQIFTEKIFFIHI